MAATIKIKNSSTAGAAPTSSDLVQGELAVNVTDKRLYTENASGTIVELGTNPSVPVTFPDGSASAPSLTNDGDTNTGLFFPAADTVGITTGGSERARIDSSGNLGLGVTPSSWTLYNSIEAGKIGNGIAGYKTGSSVLVISNAYYNSGWKYANTAVASLYEQDSAVHKWYYAASGTAGNAITFTQAMTLDASGNLGVGTTSPSYKLDVDRGASNGVVAKFGRSSGQAAYIYADTTAAFFASNASVTNGLGFYDASNYFAVFTAGAERARIDSSGNLLVGTTSGTQKLVVSGVTGEYAQRITAPSTSGTYYFEVFYAAASGVGSITSNGTTTTYGTSSDYRLKNVTGVLSGYKQRLLSLNPKQGTWKSDNSEFRGFLAHEFQTVYPASVTGVKDAVDADGNPQYQGMQAGSSEVIADLVAYIKELETRISALEAA